jgi:hypothetical protein
MFTTPKLRVTLLIVLISGAAAQAATVRGRMDCIAPNGQRQPDISAIVTVFNASIGRSGAAPVGPDGMYYLYNVPGGSYALEIWSGVNPSLPPRVFELTVFEPYTDVPVITLPC